MNQFNEEIRPANDFQNDIDSSLGTLDEDQAEELEVEADVHQEEAEATYENTSHGGPPQLPPKNHPPPGIQPQRGAVAAPPTLPPRHVRVDAPPYTPPPSQGFAAHGSGFGLGARRGQGPQDDEDAASVSTASGIQPDDFDFTVVTTTRPTPVMRSPEVGAAPPAAKLPLPPPPTLSSHGGIKSIYLEVKYVDDSHAPRHLFLPKCSSRAVKSALADGVSYSCQQSGQCSTVSSSPTFLDSGCVLGVRFSLSGGSLVKWSVVANHPL